MRKGQIGIYKHSLKVRLKMSKARKGYRHSKETKKKISSSHTGKVTSPYHCLRISQAKSGKSVFRKENRRIDKYGYVMIKISQIPKVWIKEHRFIIEKHLGRKLSHRETVHHIDEIRHNNSLSNLMVFSGIGPHTKFHRTPERVESKDIIFDRRIHIKS